VTQVSIRFLTKNRPHLEALRARHVADTYDEYREEGTVSSVEHTPSESSHEAQKWVDVQASDDFTELKHRLRKFVFPVTGLFLAWYLLYVLLADYAHGFMSTKVFGNINVGLIFGLLQFVSTFVITTLYVRHANKNLDPLAEKLRGEIEGDGK
jgi:uncharacterized membrane protein (DUF485 family)